LIWSAALPGAALRVMRTAAGRRALHVALLVGGLFVLGVLCGERAQAADGASSLKDTVGQVLDAPAKSPVGARESTVPRGSGPVQDAEQNRRPLPGNVVRAVEDGVVRPVGDAVEKVTEGLGAVARAEVPPLEALPAPPSAPSLPSLPSSPPLPALPDPSGLTDLPGRLDPVDAGPRPAPSATTPGTSSDAADASGVPGPRASDGAGGAAHDAYGPAPGHGGVSATVRADDHRAVPAPLEHAPAHQAPGSDPDGALGAASGADHGTPRQGDAHAVALHHRIAFRLVPGALVRADAAETRDRYRDIPVSPA
jgi:hypothetical protein